MMLPIVQFSTKLRMGCRYGISAGIKLVIALMISVTRKSLYAPSMILWTVTPSSRSYSS